MQWDYEIFIDKSKKIVGLLKKNLLLNVHLHLITAYTRITRLNTTCTKNTKTHLFMWTITAESVRNFRSINYY